jgi:hypothetical protein
VALFTKQNGPDTLDELVDGSEDELEPSVLDMSVVEGRNVRDEDGE